MVPLLVMILIGLLALHLFFKLLKAPLKLAFKLLLHALGGFVLLFVLNFFGSVVGITLGLTWLNALIAGVLGVPGIVLLLIVRFLL